MNNLCRCYRHPSPYIYSIYSQDGPASRRRRLSLCFICNVALQTFNNENLSKNLNTHLFNARFCMKLTYYMILIGFYYSLMDP